METNYKQTTVAGDKWQRACRVVADNPLGGAPTILFMEEEVVTLGDKTYNNMVGNVFDTFNPENPLHMDIYNKLNELYVVLREARDAATEVAQEV